MSGSLDLDLDAPLFVDATEPPLVITSSAADAGKVTQVGRVAEVMVAGDAGRVDLTSALHQLRRRGVERVLAEGGPSLNGQLLGAGLLDELNLSVSPVLTGPGTKGLTSGAPPPAPPAMRVTHVLIEDDFLFLRYVTA